MKVNKSNQKDSSCFVFSMYFCVFCGFCVFFKIEKCACTPNYYTTDFINFINY